MPEIPFGPGSSNNPIEDDWAKERNVPEITDLPNSVSAAVTAGKVVAITDNGGIATYDPSTRASDDVAFSDAVAHIENNASAGCIVFGASPSDGGRWVIESPVQQSDGDNASISIKQMAANSNFLSSANATITTTINDGSHMFILRGSSGPGGNINGIDVDLRGVDLNGNDAGVIKLRDVQKPHIRLGTVVDFAGDAVTFSSRCFEWRLADSQFGPANATARCVVTSDPESAGGAGSSPDDGVVGQFCSVETSHDVGIYVGGGTNRVTINGQWEGAEGRAEIDIPSGSSSVIIDDGTVIARTSNGAHGVYHDGGFASIAPGMIQNASGDAIRIGANAGRYKISPDIHINGESGDAVNIQQSVSSGGATSQVPYAGSFPGSTVTYPATPWLSLQHPDGWRLISEGTASVAANSIEDVDDFVGQQGVEKRAVVWPQTDDVDSRLAYGIGSRGGGATQDKLWVEEKEGNAIDVNYKVYNRS